MISEEKLEWFESKPWLRRKDGGYCSSATDIELSDEFIENHTIDEIEKTLDVEHRLYRIHSWQRSANTSQEIIIQVVYRLKLMILLNMIIQLVLLITMVIMQIK
jgi:hypothetical protein